MGKIRYLHRPSGRDDLYFRRKVPEALRSLFDCGEFYKVPLGTRDARAAEPLLAIANGEYEKKVATFQEALKSQRNDALTEEQARTLVERYLTGRSASGFASGGMRAAFILLDLDKAVDDLAGRRTPTAQSMSPQDWIAYRQRMTGADTDDEMSPEAIARIEAEHAIRNRTPGEAWFAFQGRVPRRRWRPLLADTVAAMKRHMNLADGTIPGIDEPLADALAAGLLSPEVRQQLPVAPSARRRDHAGRARPGMKLGALLARWEVARAPSAKAIAAASKAVSLFVGYVGDVGIGEITVDDCFEYRDALSMLPASMPKAQRGLTLGDVVALYETRTDVERVQPASVKKYLGAIQALLGFAFQERFIPANVAAGIKVDGYTKRSDRRPFTKQELTALFAAPLFTKVWSAKTRRSNVSDDTLRWLFLLALCTGGRIEELGQILVADVKQTDGIWYIDVSSYIDPAAAQTGAGLNKRTKTAA